MDDAIAGTTWVVQEIDGVTTTEPKPEVTFGEDGRLSGSTGVNRMMGDYTVAEGVVRLGPVASTRMAGSEEAMAQEGRVVALLSGSLSFTVDGDRLELEPAPEWPLPDGSPGRALLIRTSIQPVEP